MTHSLWNNMLYVGKESFKIYPKILLFYIVNFITELAVPLSATLITTFVVYHLTSGHSISSYIGLVLVLSLGTFLLESLRFWSYLRYNIENTFTRNSEFKMRLSWFQTTTDYMNIEPKYRRTLIEKAFTAIGSNWYGLELMMKMTPLFFINLVGMVFYGALIARYSPIVLFILFVMSVVNFWLTKKANQYLASRREEMGDDATQLYYLSEELTHPKYAKDIRIYRLDRWFKELFLAVTKRRFQTGKDVERRFLLATGSNTIFLFVRDLVAYTTLIGMVVSGTIDLTMFTFLTGIVVGFSKWLNGFVDAANQLRTSNIAVNDYRNCMDVPSVFNHGEGIAVDQLEVPLTIVFDDVTFTYPEADAPTLEHLSFQIIPGEKIALVGDNGAGKTTIVKLLCGLYRPDSGRILINGHPLDDFNLEEYMSIISVVFQDTDPLAFTIAQAVSGQAALDIDNDRLWWALEQAGLKDKIESLEQKETSYLTQIFEKSGIQLSGGETQKLMLARAIYKQAPLLILDEPTASLDPIAEESMYLKYDELVAGNTSIFISHRLSSTKFCDRILFLEHGKIVEDGSHQELMEQQGKYREIYDIQSQYYKEDASHDENQLQG